MGYNVIKCRQVMELPDSTVVASNDVSDIVARFKEDGGNVDRCNVEDMFRMDDYKPYVSFVSDFGWRSRYHRRVENE